MTGTDWKDLEAAWQTLCDDRVPQAARVELQRAARLGWWSRIYLASEVIVTLAGFAGAAWMIWKGQPITILMGIATIAFVAAAAGASLWARAQPKVRDDDAVMLAIATAIRRVEFGMRMARGTLWATCAALAYLAVFSLAINAYGLERDNGDGYIAIALSLVWLCAMLAGTLLYMQLRGPDLERLRAIEASLRAG